AAGKVNVRRALLQVVVEGGTKQLDHGTRAQIRAADANDDQYIGIALNLGRRRLDAGELFLVIVGRQVPPTEKIAAQATPGMDRLVGGANLRCKRLQFMGSNK